MLDEEVHCSHCGSRAEQEAEQQEENEAEEFEEEDLEGLGSSGACVACMKFEFQTKNRLHRNDGKTTSKLKRKYGPDDFLYKRDGARLESESDANGVVEFETEWFRPWPKIEKAIQSAVKMTQEMQDLKIAPPSAFDRSRRTFPFPVPHLRSATAEERAQGFWDHRAGKEYSKYKKKPLGAREVLEVEIVDPNWKADIQSSESMFLEHYESLLVQHESSSFVRDTIKLAGALLQIANAGNSAAKNGKLRNFLLIVTYYILRGQRTHITDKARADGAIPKSFFGLMNRTNFASIYRELLPLEEKRMFSSLVAKELILKQLDLNRSTRFFKEGYGKTPNYGRTVNAWLQSIVGSKKDLLAYKPSSGLSASMGKYDVETRANQHDRWHVKFEVRGTIMGRTKAAKDWLSYAKTLFDLACKREGTSVKLLIRQGITDEAALTNFVFHARHAELKGRKFSASETSLVDEWKAIKSKVIQPLLAKPQPELADYGGEHEGWMRGVDETEHYAPDWEQFESSESFEAFADEDEDRAEAFEGEYEADAELDEALEALEGIEDLDVEGSDRDNLLEHENGAPAHSFSDCSKARQKLLADVTALGLRAVNWAAVKVGSGYGQPGKMSQSTRALLLKHFHTTSHGHLRQILVNLMGIGKVLKEGVRFECEKSCKVTGNGAVCGYAYDTQWFGGFGAVHICFDASTGHCSFDKRDLRSQQRIVIHEVAHRYEGIEDHAYEWQTDKYKKLSTGQTLDNADSYAAFCVDIAAAAVPRPQKESNFEQLDDLSTEVEFEDEAEYDHGNAFEAEKDFEDHELDPALTSLAERVMSREAPLFEFERPKRWTSCFAQATIDQLIQGYKDNQAAADANRIDRNSCIVMLNVGLGQLLEIVQKDSRARGASERRVRMANLPTRSIEAAMGTLQKRGYALPPKRFEFYDQRKHTAGTLKPDTLKVSVLLNVLALSKSDGCWHAFGLSILDGYHSVLLLVNRRPDGAKVYWLDQFSAGLTVDVTTTLDDVLTERTKTFWQGVMDTKNKGYNTTIRLWPLRRKAG